MKLIQILLHFSVFMSHVFIAKLKNHFNIINSLFCYNIIN